MIFWRWEILNEKISFDKMGGEKAWWTLCFSTGTGPERKVAQSTPSKIALSRIHNQKDVPIMRQVSTRKQDLAILLMSGLLLKVGGSDVSSIVRTKSRITSLLTGNTCRAL
jgi:hypothetical protein